MHQSRTNCSKKKLRDEDQEDDDLTDWLFLAISRTNADIKLT